MNTIAFHWWSVRNVLSVCFVWSVKKKIQRYWLSVCAIRICDNWHQSLNGWSAMKRKSIPVKIGNQFEWGKYGSVAVLEMVNNFDRSTPKMGNKASMFHVQSLQQTVCCRYKCSLISILEHNFFCAELFQYSKQHRSKHCRTVNPVFLTHNIEFWDGHL